MKTLNLRISGMTILVFILSTTVSFAQLNESTNTTNLTTQPGSTGGPTYHSVGIGLDDPNIVRRLHIRDKFPPYLPGDAEYVPYTLGIRLDFGIEGELPFNPTQYRAWDVVNRYGNFNLYNDRIGEVEFAILGSSGFTGIGTDSPQGRLDVNSGFSDRDALFVRANAVVGGMGGVIHHQSHEFAWQTLAQNTAFENNSSLRFHFTNRTSPGEKVKSDIFVLHSSGKVGVNTSSPVSALHVHNGELTIDGSSESWTSNGWAARIQSSLGSAWVTNDAVNGQYLGFGMTNEGWGFMLSNDAPGSYVQPARYAFFIKTDGTAVAREVKVNLTDVGAWPDYVFSDSYKLTPLSEVKKFIDINGHLPNIPSAKEVGENGIELGKMNAALLRKIEELTLHMIAQDKKIEELSQIVEVQTSK